jgi:hypothetical protein
MKFVELGKMWAFLFVKIITAKFLFCCAEKIKI